jgi:hypothetical protein
MKEYNPNASVDFAAGLQNAVNSDINAIRTYNSRANQVDSDRAAIADQPLDALLGVLQFSKTLKDQFKAREEKKLTNWRSKFERLNFDLEDIQPVLSKQLKQVKETDAAFNKLLSGNTYTEEGKVFLREFSAGSQLLKQKFANTIAADGLTSYINQNLNKAYNVNGVNLSFNGAKTNPDRQNIYNQLRNEYIDSTKLNPSDEIYAEIWSPRSENYFKQLSRQAEYTSINTANQDYNKRNTEQILSAVKNAIPDVGSGQFAQLVQNHAAQFDGNVAAAFDDLYNNTLVKLIEDGQISRDEYYNFISGVIDHKGSGIVSIERGFGKKLRTTYLNEQFRKQELEKQKAALEFKKAKVKQAEQAVVEQFTVQINDGTFNKKSALVAKAELFKIDPTYDPTDIDKILEDYERSGTDVSILNSDFQKAYDQGTLTVFQVEQTKNDYLKTQWLEKAEKAEQARKGKQYKLQQKAVTNIIKNSYFAKFTDYEGGTEGTTIQGELNNMYEEKVNKYLLRANTQEEIDTAINQAAIETNAYFVQESRKPDPNIENDKGGRFYYDSSKGFDGIGTFPNIKSEIENKFKISQQPNYAEQELNANLASTKAKLKQVGNDPLKALDMPYAYLSDAEVEEAIDQMNNGSYTQWLRRLSKEFNINPHDILTRQAVALGYKQEDIPPQPASLEQIYQTANEEMVCLINKIGLDNLPTATVKRLCFNLSEEGVNDEALRQELDVY